MGRKPEETAAHGGGRAGSGRAPPPRGKLLPSARALVSTISLKKFSYGLGPFSARRLYGDHMFRTRLGYVHEPAILFFVPSFNVMFSSFFSFLGFRLVVPSLHCFSIYFFFYFSFSKFFSFFLLYFWAFTFLVLLRMILFSSMVFILFNFIFCLI
jgi:hypothetical protein